MNEPYAILLQKTSEDVANDSIEKWGIACCEFPFELDGGVKELATRDWAEEDGEDIFYPNELKLKAYDINIKLVYVGSEGDIADNILAFRDYLTGADGMGIEMCIYNSHTGIGRRGCHWVEMGDMAFNRMNDEEVLQFSLKLHISDPKTRIVPRFSEMSEIDDEEEITTKTLCQLIPISDVGD